MPGNWVTGWYAVAAGDCERARSGLIGQPVNTASSAAALLGAAAAAVLTEAAVAQRRTASARASPDGPVHARRRGRTARVIVLTALAVGLTAYLLGRTGGPLCRPESLLQPHALWHLLTAVAMAGWGADRIAHPV